MRSVWVKTASVEETHTLLRASSYRGRTTEGKKGRVLLRNTLLYATLVTPPSSPLKYYFKDKGRNLYTCNEGSNVCKLYLQEKLCLIWFPEPNKSLNKRSELVSKCRYKTKHLKWFKFNYKIEKLFITWLVLTT